MKKWVSSPRLKPGARALFELLWIGVSLAVTFLTPVHAEEPAEEEAGPVHIARETGGLIVLTVGTETQERIGMAVAPAEAGTFQPQVTAYGKLEADPAKSFTVRAPIAGFLRTSTERPWPGIGEDTGPNTVLGYVEPRFTPLEFLDLRGRWIDAQADIEAASAELDAARVSFESKSRLNTDGRLVSDTTLEEAHSRFRSAEARVEAAKLKADLLGQVLAGRSQANALFPIAAAESGEVVEVSARPGEVLDAGQALLRIARFDTVIARVSLPIGEQVELPTAPATIVILGGDEAFLPGEPIGAASTTDPLTLGQSLLFRVGVCPGHCNRPGSAVMAHIPTSGQPLGGVIIPRAAVLRYGGRTWVYVRTAEERFERRDVALYCPTPEGWFATAGVSAAESIVVESAQMLLSEELKAQIESEAAAEE